MKKESDKKLTDFSGFIEHLEKENQLVRVRSEVDPVHELAGIAKQYEGGKGVLFQRVKGSDYSVFVGMLWNRDVVARAFDTSKEQVPFVIASAIETWKKNKGSMPSQISGEGPANEIVETDVDLYQLPIPVHALKDGGRYLDSAPVLARNPVTGELNVSFHRMMVTDKDRLTFVIDPDRHLGAYLESAEKKNAVLPVTINNGVGPAPWLAAAIPKMGDNKHEIAHHMVGRPIPFIKAQTIDVPAYADAQFVIEAEILPRVREEEGPFGEATGYYAERGKRYVMKVRAITHKNDAVFHSLITGVEVWTAVAMTAEAKIFEKIKKSVPELMAVHLPPGGCGYYTAVVQINKTIQGLGKRVIEETFKAFNPLQRVVSVDADINLYDPVDVEWALTTRFDPDTDMLVLKDQWGHVLNPMVKTDSERGIGTVTKIGMDATAPYERKERFERVSYQEVDLKRYNVDE